MKSRSFLLVAAAIASASFCSAADIAMEAAKDPSSITKSAKTLKADELPAFAADAINAISTMPKSPEVKLEKFIEAATALIEASTPENIDDVIVAMTSNIPFEYLPEWSRAVSDIVQLKTKNLSVTDYNAIVNGSMQKITNLKDFSAEDKAIVSTFTLILFTRGNDVDAQVASVKDTLQNLPKAYKEDVASALPAALKGEYSSILGDTPIVHGKRSSKRPKAVTADKGSERPEAQTADDDPLTGEEDGDIQITPFDNAAEELLPSGVNAIAIKTTVPPAYTPSTPSTPSTPQPPVLEPYEAQF